MKRLSLLLVAALSFAACSKKDPNTIVNPSSNKVLLVKVDYLTNQFEGGQEITFNQSTTGFTASITDTPAGDFGSVKIMYDEMNAPLFYGTVVWMGLGEQKYPETMLPPSAFANVITNDYITPINGFQQINQIYAPNEDHMTAWASAQGLVATRSYLSGNPTQVVKAYLYTPSVGSGNPADWDWYFFLKQ